MPGLAASCRAEIPRTCLLVVVAVICPACSKTGEDAVAVYPVNGQVLFEGNKEPPEGAFVVFKPIKEMPQLEKTGGNPRGTVGKDGKFKLTTHRPDDGAPAGEYSVIITWHKAKDGEADDGPDLLKGRYRDPASSRLPRMTVKEGNNDLPPIRLKGP